jgi:hypothetical protein
VGALRKSERATYDETAAGVGDRQAQAEGRPTMNATYKERLSIMWLLTWRGILVNGALGGGAGFVIGFVLAIVGLAHLANVVAIVAALLLGLLVGTPLIVKMMLDKQYRGFRLQLVRQ